MPATRGEIRVEISRVVDNSAANLDVGHAEQAQYAVLFERAFSNAEVFGSLCLSEPPPAFPLRDVRQISYSCIAPHRRATGRKSRAPNPHGIPIEVILERLESRIRLQFVFNLPSRTSAQVLSPGGSVTLYFFLNFRLRRWTLLSNELPLALPATC